MSQKIFIIHDYPTDEATWREWFAQDLNRVEPWLEAARGLIDHVRIAGQDLRARWKAADPQNKGVPPPLDFHGVYLLLAAFAAEDLLKAAIVFTSHWPDAAIRDEIPADLKTHNLIQLATKAAVSLNPDEEELLERLTQFAVWQGRYPAPTSLEEMKPRKLRSGLVSTAGLIRGSDMREVEEFLNRLNDLLAVHLGQRPYEPFPSIGPEPFEGVVVSPELKAHRTLLRPA